MTRRCAGARLALLAAALAATLGSAAARAEGPDAALVELGRRIYVDGVLPSGEPLLGTRPGAGPVSGAQAACLTCHRRSGLGGVEGDVQVPPISGRALHAGTALKDRIIVSLDPRRGRAWNQTHPPYNDASLLLSLREGVTVTGRTMLPLMPRYTLSDADFAALNAYLDQLSDSLSPGVTAKGVRLATVITPGADPARRAAFLEVMRVSVDQKNSNTQPGRRHMINAAESILGSERRWDLDVWELTGPPEGWLAQLEALYAKAPVFALVSGLGDDDWAPVQAFCERERVPLWFPSVAAAPATAGEGAYGLYFSRGTPLEADAIASALVEARQRPARIVELVAAGSAPALAAAELRARLDGAIPVEERRVSGAGELRAALAGVTARDALVLWLRPAQLAALGALPPPAATVYVSARLATGLLPELPPAWRARALLAYPYDLPPLRDYNIASFSSWLALRNIALVDPVLQSEAYFAMGYLQFTLSEMLDNVHREYLIDRGENMLVRREAQRAEEETLIRQQGHPPAKSVQATSRPLPGAIYGTDPHGPLAQKNTPALGVRQGTTIYPRLSLAPGQRFASKGAYLVRYAPDGKSLIAVSDWLVP